MERFQTFNLGNAIATGQRLRANRMKLDAAQTEADRSASLKQLAAQSTKPTYDVDTYDREGPNKPTGTEYSSDKHLAGLRERGETKQADALERHVAGMDAEKRKQMSFDAEQGAIEAFNADTEDKWELLQDRLAKESEISGKDFYPRTWGERQEVINEARKLADLTGDSKKSGKSDAFERARDDLFKRGLITQEQFDTETKSRMGILSGTVGKEATKGSQELSRERLDFAKDKQGFVVKKDRRKATTTYRTEAATDVKDLTSMRLAAERGIILAKKGGSLNSRNIKILLSQLAGSKVRALAQQQQFASYGSLDERALNLVNEWIKGGYSDELLDQSLVMFQTMLDDIITPALEKSNGFYRRLAKDDGLDPHKVVPFESSVEVRQAWEDGLLSADEARKILSSNKGRKGWGLDK